MGRGASGSLPEAVRPPRWCSLTGVARSTLIAPILAAAGSLRFPVLLSITAVLFVADLLIPDAIPFVDELLLGLTTAVLAGMRKRKSDEAPDRTDGADG